MHGHGADDEADPGDLDWVRDLPEDQGADQGGGGRQEGEHESEGRAGQSGHRELIGDIGDDRGTDPYRDPGQQ
jgi:hypothetical protein